MLKIGLTVILFRNLRKFVERNSVRVQYIPTTEMTADSLTKALGHEKREKCTARMGMTP